MAETIKLTVQEEKPIQMAPERARIIEAVSPEASVERIPGGVEITVKDYRGTTSAVVNDGAVGAKGDKGDKGDTGNTGAKGDKGDTGAKGDDGADGFSPTATVSKSGATATITITDKNGTTTATVSDGDPTELIDDESEGADNVWSAQKVAGELEKKADIIISSASGSVASFPDGADDQPVRELTVGIEPVQDLHGYDSPWPAGGGKNLYNGKYVDSAYFNESDAYSSSLYPGNNAMPITPGNKYTASINGVTAGIRYVFLDEEKTAIGSLANADTTDTAPENAKYLRWRIRTNAVENEKYQIEAGTTASTWSPYSNICPITGWSGANVSRTGINIWDEVAELGYINTETGAYENSQNHLRTKNKFLVKENTYYYFVCNRTGTLGNFGMCFYDKNDQYVGKVIKAVNNNFLVPSGASKAAFFVPLQWYGDTTYQNDISINYPYTDTAYHPGHVQTLPIPFPSEAGTVYGGSLDVTTGTLTVDRASVDLGTLTFTKNDSSLIGLPCFYATVPSVKAGASYVACSDYAIKRQRTNIDGTGQISPGNGSDATYCVIRDDRYATVDAASFKTAMSGVQLVYELATPVTYSLTPQELRTLLGQNNIWADTGDTSVSYPADTKLYIDNKITQAIAAALNA